MKKEINEQLKNEQETKTNHLEINNNAILDLMVKTNKLICVLSNLFDYSNLNKPEKRIIEPNLYLDIDTNIVDSIKKLGDTFIKLINEPKKNEEDNK